MTEDDPLFLWRLSDHLSVEDAAILIAGGDPSAEDEVYLEGLDRMHTVRGKRTDGHPGFVPAFTALKTAVRQGKLSARFEYKLSSGYKSRQDEDCWVVSHRILDDPAKLEIIHGKDDSISILMWTEPDWSRTMLDVLDLKVWLQEKGLKTGFFFPASQAGEDDFMDPSHKHFAPELALAAAAWRGLSQRQKSPKGVKAAIDEWITSNPSAWLDEEKISTAARDRIITLANWNRSGGANPTGG